MAGFMRTGDPATLADRLPAATCSGKGDFGNFALGNGIDLEKA